MNKKILFSILSNVLVLPSLVLADTGSTDYKTITDKIVETTLYIASAIVVIGWVITGILFLTAQGAPEKLGTARKALIAAVVGTALIIVAASAVSLIKSALGLS